MRAAFLGLLAIAAAAQDQTGRVEGVVLDAISHQPVKKATVDIEFIGNAIGQIVRQPQSAITDTSGTFEFHGLPAGRYQITVIHQSYPQARFGGVRKNVEVSAGEAAARVTVELLPGAAVTGRIVDEDGDPMSGCFVQPHPAKNFNGGVLVTPVPLAGNDGSYRLVNIPPGKYILNVQCRTAAFQPRPLSAGPDPPPSAAYPVQFYAGASDPESAQIVELTPGAERSGIDFQMRPVPVTHIHGTLTAASADWHGRNDLEAQLRPLDRPASDVYFDGRVDPVNGSFEIPKVFPGSYRLIVFSRNAFERGGNRGESPHPVGATARVDVADKPVEISLPFYRGVDVSGRIEIEHSDNTANQIAPEQIGIQLTSEEYLFGPPPSPVQPGEDGTFTIKSVLPGEWRINLRSPSAFLKSAWLGTEDVTHGALDLTSGSVAPLRILVSGNTATIRGTAPDSQIVSATLIDAGGPSQKRSERTDSNGQFTIPGLAPGKYRVVGLDSRAPFPEEGGQEVTLREGETAVIDVKPEPKP